MFRSRQSPHVGLAPSQRRFLDQVSHHHCCRGQARASGETHRCRQYRHAMFDPFDLFDPLGFSNFKGDFCGETRRFLGVGGGRRATDARLVIVRY